MSVYFVPSAVFWSVTGSFTVSVSVGAPLAYEPPTTVIFAVFAVRAASWKIGFAAGNAPPVETDSETPLTEMTAVVTGAAGVAGGFGGVGGVGGGLPVPVPPEPEPELFGAELFGLADAALNGSLLSKSENDCSCPVPAVGLTALTRSAFGSADAVEGVLDASGEVVGVPASVGAVGVDPAGATVGVAAAGAACGVAPLLFSDV